MKREYIITGLVILTVGFLVYKKDYSTQLPDRSPIEGGLELNTSEIENGQNSLGMKLISKADPKKIEYKETPTHIGDGEWADPEYRKMLLRHFELKTYLQCEIKDDPVFQEVESFLRSHGYDQQYVRAFYQQARIFNQRIKFMLKIDGLGDPAIEGFNESQLSKLESIIRTNGRELTKLTGIDKPELINGIFYFQPTNVFRPAYVPSGMEGEKLILSIESDALVTIKSDSFE